MFDILVNPKSGNGKGVKALLIIKNILDEKGIAYNVYETEYPHHATEIVRKLNKQPHTDLIMMGGDGTFNEVLNGIDNFETINVGAIPCGSGNDFARAAKFSTNAAEAMEVILKNNLGYVDFIQLEDRRALNCAGAGMDVDVLVKYNKMKGSNPELKYLLALISTLLHLRFHKLRLTVNGEVQEKNVFLIVVANGTSIGGGMPISPNSAVDDKMLNIVAINKLPKRKILPTLLKFLKGKHIDMPCTEQYLAKEALIEILDDSATEVDGQVFEGKKLECKIVSDTFRCYR
jgi:YegS/Rv2252/BmrU family lipid kinase